jgi:hypothetical protein
LHPELLIGLKELDAFPFEKRFGLVTRGPLTLGSALRTG